MSNLIKIWCSPEYKGEVPQGIKEGDAGLDLCYSGKEPMTIDNRGSDIYVVPSGIHVAIPKGYVGLIWGRSGVSAKNGLTVHAGVIDSNYRGPIGVIVSAKIPINIEPGDRLAQMVVVPCITELEQVLHLQDLGRTDRGEKGFGSSGK